LTRTFTPEQARRYYERNAHKQDAQGWYEDSALDRLIALGDFGNASDVLEVGCGTGKLAEMLLRDHLPAHATYVGIDISMSMLARAGTRLKHYVPRAKLAPGDITLGLAAGTHTKDRMVAAYVFDLLSLAHSKRLLEDMHRVLRPGGLICIAGLTRETQEPDINIFSQLWALMQRVWPSLVGGCRPVQMLPLLAETQWQIVANETVAPRGLASEILIARKM